MIKQRRSTWPLELGPDTALARARVISRGWRDVAIQLASTPHAPEEAQRLVAAVEAMCIRVGEGGWQIPSPAPIAGAWRTREDVALLGGVRPTVVGDWTSRGLLDRQTGEWRKLTRHPEGYHPDETDQYLAWREDNARLPVIRSSTRKALPCPSTRPLTAHLSAPPPARGVASAGTSTC